MQAENDKQLIMDAFFLGTMIVDSFDGKPDPKQIVDKLIAIRDGKETVYNTAADKIAAIERKQGKPMSYDDRDVYYGMRSGISMERQRRLAEEILATLTNRSD